MGRIEEWKMHSVSIDSSISTPTWILMQLTEYFVDAADDISNTALNLQ